MNQLVFYWSGENVEIPKILVKSVLISNEGLKIIQVTDKKTDKIEGVNEVVRIDKTDNIIMDRIKGWSLIDTKNNQTLFIDADTILLKKIDFKKFQKGNYLYKRTTSKMFNNKYEAAYPELANKETIETMPFLAGIVFIVKEDNFYKELKILSQNLSPNLKKWFGDQILLKNIYEKKHKFFNLIDENFIKVVEVDKGSKKININLSKLNTAITFKGSSKKYMEFIFNEMLKNNFYKV